jgi:predicted Zn finger-like uncharacterized protein
MMTSQALKALLILASAAISAVSAFSPNAAVRGQRSIGCAFNGGNFFKLQESNDPESSAPAPGAGAEAPKEASVDIPSVADGAPAERPDTYVRCGKCQTIYAITEEDLGPGGRGRRLECSVCNHSWFQSKDRIMAIKDGYEYVVMPDSDLERITQNIDEGRPPAFMGEFKLYVGNIAFESTEEDVNEIFSEIGPVGDVSLVRDDLGRIRGFGFVTMREKEDGQKAIDALDGSEIRGRTIAVRESNN